MRVLVRVQPRSIVTGGIAVAIAFTALSALVLNPVGHTRASMRPLKSEETATTAAPTAKLSNNNSPDDDIVLASPGRIEGRSDTIEVGAAIDGVIESLYVKEGQWVAKGQILAELDCRDLRSTLPVTRAEAESLRQVRARLLLGSRQEERQAAAHKTLEAKVVLAHANTQLERQRQLAEVQAVSRSTFDDAKRDADVAEAEYQVAIRNEALVNAGPLDEEIAKATADMDGAEQRVGLAEEKLAKCTVTAPMNGTVLRIMLHPSESFALVAPRPILTMADISGRRVRAEVDERDVSKIHIGQTLVVSSEAYSGERFSGKVFRISPIMGRKSVITGDPADKVDRDVLEVLADLEPTANSLPLGLRTTVHFHH